MFNPEAKYPSYVFPRTLTGINASVSLYRDTLIIRRKGNISGLKPSSRGSEQEIHLHHVLRVETGNRIIRFEFHERDSLFVLYAPQDEALARDIVRFVRRQIAERSKPGSLEVAH